MRFPFSHHGRVVDVLHEKMFIPEAAAGFFADANTISTEGFIMYLQTQIK
jgi:hypothetical protein